MQRTFLLPLLLWLCILSFLLLPLLIWEPIEMSGRPKQDTTEIQRDQEMRITSTIARDCPRLEPIGLATTESVNKQMVKLAEQYRKCRRAIGLY